MELRPTIEAVRALLSQGDTAAAFRTLRIFLEKNNRRHPDALSAVRALEANYAGARQQEQKGILSVEEARREYSRANDALLALLDDLETGRAPTSPRRARRYRALWIGAAAVLVLAAAAVWYFRPAYECPKFGDGLRVLLLPFQNVGGEQRKPELILLDEIAQRTAANQLPASVKVLGISDSESNRLDADAVREIGQTCKADLVVWGRYSTGDSTRVNVHYVFVAGERKEGATGYQAFKDLTDLASGVLVKRTLDDALFSICARMALSNDNLPLAKKWLEKVKEPDARDMAMSDWVGKKVN